MSFYPMAGIRESECVGVNDQDGRDYASTFIEDGNMVATPRTYWQRMPWWKKLHLLNSGKHEALTPRRGQVLEAIRHLNRTIGATSNKAIADFTGIGVTQVNHHVNDLIDMEVVEKNAGPRSIKVRMEYR